MKYLNKCSSLLLVIIFLTGHAYAQPNLNALADQVQQINEKRLANINSVVIVSRSDMPMMNDEVSNVFIKQVIDGRTVLVPESDIDSDHDMVGGMFDGSFEELIRGADSIENDRYEGNEVYKIHISDRNLLNEYMEQDIDFEDEIMIESAVMLLDRNELVPLKMQFFAADEIGFSVTILAEDYRKHNGIPIAHTVRFNMDGVDNLFSEEDRVEARMMLEQFEQQLSQMPEAQREMIERQMAGQMDQFRAMLEGEEMGDFTITVISVDVN